MVVLVRVAVHLLAPIMLCILFLDGTHSIRLDNYSRAGSSVLRPIEADQSTRRGTRVRAAVTRVHAWRLVPMMTCEVRRWFVYRVRSLGCGTGSGETIVGRSGRGMVDE
jgi:hypothetical protein